MILLLKYFVDKNLAWIYGLISEIMWCLPMVLLLKYFFRKNLALHLDFIIEIFC